MDIEYVKNWPANINVLFHVGKVFFKRYKVWW